MGGREASDLDVGHFVLFYAGASQYRAGVAAFINEGLDHGEPVLVAVPADRQQVVEEALGARAQAVTFAGMGAVGGNPARIIPAVWDFIDQHDHRRARVVGEPAWPARTIDEACEVCRHEALVNVAFAGTAATFLCPYDSARLPAWVVANALATHPAVFGLGVRQLNDTYLGPVIPPACEAPLPAPPAAAEALTYVDDLRPVRALVTGQARSAGLSDDRTADLIIAVSELAANTLQHAPGGGTIYAWNAGDQIVCQVYDHGQITDPLAGRRPPIPGSRGNGLWVVNQLCDLVEIRTGPGGTTIRVRMNLKPVKAYLDGRQLRLAQSRTAAARCRAGLVMAHAGTSPGDLSSSVPGSLRRKTLSRPVMASSRRTSGCASRTISSRPCPARCWCADTKKDWRSRRS